jgi:outer membrane autotransporter protein
MKFNSQFLHATLSLLAFAAGTSAAADPLSPAGVAALKIERGVVYHEAPLLAASGGSAPYTFAFEGSGLPPGLRLDARGLLSGITCGTAGSFNLGVVTVTDAAGASTRASLADLPLAEARTGGCTLTVGAAWNASSVGQPFGATLVASGGRAPYTFSVISGQLPAGLALQPNGAISGTPTASASHRFTVVARDAHGASGVHDAVLNVIELSVSPPTLASGSVGDPYHQTLSASGGSGPYSYAVTAGSLPAGLSLSRSGKLTGTPVARGQARFTITATDTSQAASARSYTVRIGAPNVASASTYLNPTAAAMAQPSVAARGSAVHNFAAAPVTGAAPGHTTRTLDAVDPRVPSEAAGASLLDVQPRSFSVPQAGVPVAAPMTARGGTGPYRFAIVRGALPEGLTLDGTSGQISGRARRAGSEQVTLQVTDAHGDAANVEIGIHVGARADPAADAVVAGLQASEAETLKRLSAAQMRNVLTRLDGDTDCRPGWEQQIRLNTAWRDARPAGLAMEAPPQADRRSGCTSGPSAWAAGTVDYGRVAGALGAAGSRFSSPGLTAGVDLAPLHGVRSGIALGHGQDHSEINGGLGRVDSRSESITAYGSWQAPLGVRVNAALGQALTLLDSQRGVSGDGLAVQGQRRVMQRYGALAGSTRFGVGDWSVSPRVGVEHLSAALDGYTESGASPPPLGYDAARLESSDVRGGLALTRQWRPSLWTVEPELSVDWHKRLQGGMTQNLRYADDPLGSSYTLASTEPVNEFAQVGVGVRMRHTQGWSVSLGARSTLEGAALRSAGYSAGVLWPF